MLEVDLVLWALVTLLLGGAICMSLPRPPALDWELHFKVTLVGLLRGELELAGEEAEAWLEAGRSRVWYHPGARDLDRKLQDPESYEIPVPAREGERALVEALARRGPEERLAHTFGRGADEILYEDPVFLGEDYDPASVLAPGCDWEAVVSFSEPVQAALKRRQEHNVWVVLGHPAIAGELTAFLGDRVHSPGASSPESLCSELETLLEDPADRLVVLVSGEDSNALLRALHAEPALRDRVLAVVGICAAFRGELAAWMKENFNHVSMDTEVSRSTPYFHLGFLAPEQVPPGLPGLSLAEMRWPHRPTPPSGRRALEVIDLGVLPVLSWESRPDLLARSLALTINARLVSGG